MILVCLWYSVLPISVKVSELTLRGGRFLHATRNFDEKYLFIYYFLYLLLLLLFLGGSGE